MIELLSPVNGEEFSITTEIYKEFKKREYAGEHRGTPEEAYKNMGEYYDLKSDASFPASVRLVWKNTCPNAENHVTLRLASGKSMPAAVGYIKSTMYSAADDVYYADVTNLLSGEEYLWSIDGVDGGSFRTVRGEMRNMLLPVMTNVRDMGGRLNIEGKMLRQGMIYRGTAPDDLGDPDIKGSREMRKTVQEQLGIKCDIDLRAESVGKCTSSPLGDDVRYELIPFDAYGGTLNDGGRAKLRRILELIADESNYPIYYHCAAGADRTGTIGAYLDAILGMSDDEIKLNYNVTTLAVNDVRCWYDGDCGAFHDYLEETYPDLTIGKRIMANLRLSGIAEETIEVIRKLLID